MTDIKQPVHLTIHTPDVKMHAAFAGSMKNRKPSNIAGKEFFVVSTETDGRSVRAHLTEFTRLDASCDDLPPLESIVRIVPGDATIWDVAEQFVGVDCRLKAVFMLEETRMVAVENIETGQCCCFWASMVRTPEQAKAEEREAGIENLLDWVAAQTKVDRAEVYKKNWAVLYDAGLRPPVNP